MTQIAAGKYTLCRVKMNYGVHFMINACMLQKFNNGSDGIDRDNNAVPLILYGAPLITTAVLYIQKSISYYYYASEQ